MNPRRIGILVVAIVVAAVAAIGLLNYVRNVEDTAFDDGESAQVWVVKQPVRKGTSASQALAQQMIVQEEFPAKYRPANAIENPDQELVGLVAVFDLPANEIIKEGNFVEPNVINTGITDRLAEKDHVTVTFSVDQVNGVAYQVEPGDFVNILKENGGATGNSLGEPAEGADPATSAEGAARNARYIYQKAEVLSIDRDLVPDISESQEGEDLEAGPQEARSGGMITLSVPPEAVQTILNEGKENLYLSLVPRNYVPRPLPPLEPTPQLPGEDAERLTPYGPDDPAVITEEEG